MVDPASTSPSSRWQVLFSTISTFSTVAETAAARSRSTVGSAAPAQAL